MKISVIIPIYNEAATCIELINKVQAVLLEKEIISVKKTRKHEVLFIIENYEEKFQHRIEKKTNHLFHDLKLQIKRLDSDYPHKDIDEKILLANSLLTNLVLSDNGFTLLDSFKNPKKTLYMDEHLEIQQ